MGKVKDICGQKFGRLTVIKYAGADKNGNALFECECECGNHLVTRGERLRRGGILSCGCANAKSLVGAKFHKLTVIDRDGPYNHGDTRRKCACECGAEVVATSTELRRGQEKREDLTGMSFNKWTVLEYVGKDTYGNHQWRCQCECGTTRVVAGCNLKSGISKSCGCLNGIPHLRHGGSYSRLYGVWRHMRERCNNPSNSHYKDYGGRGIKVCSEWENRFSAFQSWAIRSGYDASAPYGICTIDRIDVNGNYEPGNCRWATAAQQAHNKRNNVFCEFGGENMSFQELSSRTGISASALYSRWRHGDRGEDLIRPVGQKKQIKQNAPTVA